METYWGRIRQLSASSPFCCHYPQAPPCLMAGQPARNRARPKIKRCLFSIQAIVTQLRTVPPLPPMPRPHALLPSARTTLTPCVPRYCHLTYRTRGRALAPEHPIRPLMRPYATTPQPPERPPSPSFTSFSALGCRRAEN